MPTGNFGNVFAAWAARRMGLPIARLVVGSNRNDILSRFLAANDMSARAVEPSLSPSMDIQVSSNFERLLFELLNRDAGLTTQTVLAFRELGRMPVPEPAWQRARQIFRGFCLTDPETEAEIRSVHEAAGYLADPHTAIGIAAARALPVRTALPRSRSRPPTRQNSRTPWSGQSETAQSFRPGSPISMNARSGMSFCLRTWRGSRRRSGASRSPPPERNVPADCIRRHAGGREIAPGGMMRVKLY